MKTLGEEDQGFLVECRALERSESFDEGDSIEEELTVEESVAVVLKSFEDVFEWPEALPPRRAIEHHIYLKKGVDPVNVRPYRYAYQQKTEMEKLVEEMLSLAVLVQNKQPIAYYSHTLVVRDRAKPVYERELMAVVMAVQRWRPYLLGRKFLVKTDQRSLKFLLEQRVIQPQYQKWISKLLGYRLK